jgi:hypothetical protein
LVACLRLPLKRRLQSTLNILKSMSLNLLFFGGRQSDGVGLLGFEDSLGVEGGVGRVWVGRHETTGRGRVAWMALFAAALRLGFRAFLRAPEGVVCALR